MPERRLINTAGRNTAAAADRIGDAITAAARRYEAQQPRPDAQPGDRVFLAWYRGLLIQIGQQIGQQIGDVQTLDALFRQVYIPMSLQYGIVPKIIDFCLLTGIDYNTLTTGINNSAYNNILNNWNNLCKEYLLQGMIDNNSSSINHIFIAKAVYGLTDQPRQQAQQPGRITKTDRETIIAELQGQNVENPGNVENFNEQDS